MLLATSALASAALPTAVAHADDAVWNPAGDTNFNNNGNWTDGAGGAGVVPTGTATFNVSDTRAITFNDLTTTLGGMTVTSGAGDYKFETNGKSITFNGAGLSVGSGASLTINNRDGGTVIFSDSSNAGSNNSNADHAVKETVIDNFGGKLLFAVNASAETAVINNFSSGTDVFKFDNESTAAAARIQNHGDLHFVGNSTAGNAFIVSFIQSSGSESHIFIEENANGGTARIQLDNGSLDISKLVTVGTTVGTTVGSIEGSGNVFLGSKNLKVGGNNLQFAKEFSGVIQDGGDGAGIGGSLTKEGTGALTLTGINTYTGKTDVNGGFLVVDGLGSIASSSGVTVNAGGTLAGTGTVASTIVDGGTLAPGHSDGSFGKLKVQGDLLFTQGAGTTSTYLVQVSPANATSTSVTGSARFNGATVQANFAPGSYVPKEYNILHAGDPLSDKFGSLVTTTNLSPMFKATLSYDANNVFLDLSANSGAISGLNTNQRNVSNAIFNSLNLMNGLPFAFMTATQAPASLTQISGETAVGTQQATFDAMNQFMGVMLDPTVGALSGGRTKDAFAAMPGKAAPLAAEAFNARWGVWAAGFGAEYRFSPNTVAGFALAGGGTNFRVANGGSGNSDLFQAGAYLRHTQGAAFIAAALAYGWQDVTTNRTVTVAGIDNLRGRFNSNAISGRLEGGYKVATQAGEFTPYAAGQFTSYHLPSYTEQVASGANTFALSYNGKDVTATRSELGLRSEKAVALTDSTLMLRGRLAWAHDFNTDRNVQATFLALPGSAFVVNGASPAADTALTTISAEMLWRNGWSASATADAQLSDTTHSYSGKGVIRYSW